MIRGSGLTQYCTLLGRKLHDTWTGARKGLKAYATSCVLRANTGKKQIWVRN